MGFFGLSFSALEEILRANRQPRRMPNGKSRRGFQGFSDTEAAETEVDRQSYSKLL